MRIAIPVNEGVTASTLANCEGFMFFEDDHGHITRRFFAELPEKTLTAAIALLEQNGIDALICGNVDLDERREVFFAGIMLFPGAVCTAEEAAKNFLSGAVVRDPANTCNACGFNASCSIYANGGICQ